MKCLLFFKTKWAVFGYGILLGTALVLGLRFVLYTPADQVHYHANFAVYINGQRQLFRGPQFYEESAMCSVSQQALTPLARAHMHDQVNDVVHVEDHAVTWGQFFNNLGMSVGKDFIETGGQLYVADGQNRLHVILNNQDYTDITSIANMVIKDQDRLLVSFGTLPASTLQQEFAAVPHTAHTYDVTPDPVSCSGHTTSNVTERLKHLL